MPSDPTETLSSPRVGKTLPKALTVQEIDELLEQPRRRSTPEAKRDKAMLELLYATGLRVSELVALNLDSIELRNNRATVRCVGKAGKERLIPIHEQAVHALRIYLQEARPDLCRSKREKGLFINRRGERLTRQGFWLIPEELRQGHDDHARCHAAHAAPLVRDAHAAGRGAVAQRAGVAGPREHLDDAGVHAADGRARAPGLRERAPARPVGGRRIGCWHGGCWHGGCWHVICSAVEPLLGMGRLLCVGPRACARQRAGLCKRAQPGGRTVWRLWKSPRGRSWIRVGIPPLRPG